MSILRDKFCENFKVNHLTLEIMDLVDEFDLRTGNVLEKFMTYLKTKLIKKIYNVC